MGSRKAKVRSFTGTEATSKVDSVRTSPTDWQYSDITLLLFTKESLKMD
jgi:hypothetical protein